MDELRKANRKVNWNRSVRKVMMRANHGCRLSEFYGLDLAVAQKLMDRGKIHGTKLADGDYLLNK